MFKIKKNLSMLKPKNSKYRKAFRGKISGCETKVIELAFGNFGIKVLKSGRIPSKRLEAVRKALSKELKGHGKLWLRIFPHVPVTSKPAETRMGKGKGNVSHYCCMVKAGRIVFEFQGIPTYIMTNIIKIASTKLSLPIKMIQL